MIRRDSTSRRALAGRIVQGSVPGVRRRFTHRQLRCFTLIELVTAIVVGAIVSGTAAMLIMSAARQRAEVSARSELIDQGSAALECIIRYVREVSQDECPLAATPCLNGNAQISTAAQSDLRFDAIGFRLSAGRIEMTNNAGSAWWTLCAGVTGLTFTYYDRNGVVLSSLPLTAGDRAKIRRVSVQIDLVDKTETARIRTSIFLRNFMNEVTLAP
ncbi:MAG: hypothetical protein KF841_07770 [Phycisphaerae bacterium]|nr:hypothetical protein [Phycisphaerae bacterium]